MNPAKSRGRKGANAFISITFPGVMEMGEIRPSIPK
jgi:hypothetical protein